MNDDGLTGTNYASNSLGVRPVYKLFYFFNLFSQPIKLSCCIYLFRNIRYLMSYHIFDGVLIHAIFFRHRDEVFTAVMRTMFRVQIELITNTAEYSLITVIGKLDIFLPAIRINIVEQIFAPQLFGFFIFSFHKRLNSGMDGYSPVFAGLKWNPYNDNTCWVWERDRELEISIIYDDKLGERIYIDILHNY